MLKKENHFFAGSNLPRESIFFFFFFPFSAEKWAVEADEVLSFVIQAKVS